MLFSVWYSIEFYIDSKMMLQERFCENRKLQKLEPPGNKNSTSRSTNRHLQHSKTSCRDGFKMSKRQLFWKSKQWLTKALIRHLKKTSQRHLRSVSQTLLRPVTKPFLRYLKDSCFANLTNICAKHCLKNLYVAENCLGRISWCLTINFFEIQGSFYLI